MYIRHTSQSASLSVHSHPHSLSLSLSWRTRSGARLKRPGDEMLEEKAVKRQRDLEMEGYKKDGILSLLFNEPDETLNEVMKLLDEVDNGASCTTAAKVRFINNPYSPSSYFTVDGNEKSCGSSFSDLESTCMAGVDMCCGGLGIGAEMMGLEFDRWLMEQAKARVYNRGGSACAWWRVGRTVG